MSYTVFDHELILSDEFEMVWKEATVSYLKVLVQHLPGQTGLNHKRPQSQLSTSS
jgi:hypothetical protein